MRLPFDPDTIPKRWYGGNAVATHVVNGVSLLFPAGERFFVRSVRRYFKNVSDDPVLTKQIRGFFGQEGKHAHEHERHRKMLEAQGYEVREFLDAFERSLRFLEELAPDALNLSATAAAEHFTAIMAENAFDDIELFEHVDPVMRDLLLWHAAEEIEHKAVAFDVLKRVAPNHALRVAGMAIAAVFLAYWWQRGTRMLLAQENLSPQERAREAQSMKTYREEHGKGRTILRDVFLRGIREYLERDFHPWNNEASALVKEYLADLDARL